MSLVGPWLSTTSTKKRKVKMTKSGQEELERGWRERNVRLKQMGLPKETLEQYTDWLYGRGKKSNTKKIGEKQNPPAPPRTPSAQKSSASCNHLQVDDRTETETQTSDVVVGRLASWVTGPVATKQTPAYTGTKIIGIGTMHKSNAVPIFSDDEAKDISSMRR